MNESVSLESILNVSFRHFYEFLKIGDVCVPYFSATAYCTQLLIPSTQSYISLTISKLAQTDFPNILTHSLTFTTWSFRKSFVLAVDTMGLWSNEAKAFIDKLDFLLIIGEETLCIIKFPSPFKEEMLLIS